MKLKKSIQAQLWEQARQRCQLSDGAIQMAKELGLSPRSLIKNIPSRTEPWKAPVEDWVRTIYEKRHKKSNQKAGNDKAILREPAPGQ